MKVGIIFLTGLLSLCGSAYCQTAALTKLYFFSSPPSALVTTLNPSQPIKINRCTLLETDLDSLGLKILDNKTIYIHFERGKTYYYRSIAGTGAFNYFVDSCTEQDFWLNVYFVGARVFRHYTLTQAAGLKLVEEK